MTSQGFPYMLGKLKLFLLGIVQRVWDSSEIPLRILILVIVLILSASSHRKLNTLLSSLHWSHERIWVFGRMTYKLRSYSHYLPSVPT